MVGHRTRIFSCFVSVVLVGCLLINSVGASSALWNQTYGGVAGDYARSLVETSDRGYVIAGYTKSFETGAYDAWLIKTDKNGHVEWNQTYGACTLQCLIKTSDGGFAFTGSNRLVKTDSYGNMELNKTYGSGAAYSLVEASDGGCVIAGGIYSFEDNSDNFWLLKVDANGNVVWNKTYNNGVDETAYSLVATSDGGYALAGVTKYFDIFTFPDDYYSDFWLVKTDANGNAEWNKTYQGERSEIARSLVQTSDGGYALAGLSTLHYDIWLVKTDTNGNMQWSQTIGEAYRGEEVYSLIATSDGGLALAASTNSLGAGSLDFWLVKTDAHGNIKWNQTYGGTKFDLARSLVETSDGGYAIAGETYSFGAGDSDFWLVKTGTVGIIPEFPYWIILTLLLVTTLTVTIYIKTLHRTTKQSY